MAATAPLAPASARHPSYEQMIVRAIHAENRVSGSSQLSISKFLTENYSGLSANHDAQLTRQLRTLVRTGVLYMVNGSYKVTATTGASRTRARASGTPSGASGRPQGRPRMNQAQKNDALVVNIDHETAQALLLAAQKFEAAIVKAQETAKSGKKRKRGRPLLRRSQGSSSVPSKRGRGRPPLPRKVETQPTPENRSGPHGEKRKPGRPRKIAAVNNELSSTAVAEKALVPYGEKKRPDRDSVEPTVDKQVTVTSKGMEGTGDMTEGSGSRKLGRPKKILTTNAAEDNSPATVKHGRGRPPKNKDSRPSTGEKSEIQVTAEKAVQEQGEITGASKAEGAPGKRAEKPKQGNKVTVVGPEYAMAKLEPARLGEADRSNMLEVL